MRLAVILLTLMCTPMVLALSSTVVISPLTNVTTTHTLNCLITPNGTGSLSANITWYVDGSPHGSDNETLTLYDGVENSTKSQGAIEPSDTLKGEQWICQATLTNGTATNVTNSTAITIENSPPVVLSPISSQIAYEDSSFGPIAASASDPDTDPIIMWLSADLNASQYGNIDLFEITSGGVIQFTPAASDIGNHTMALIATDGQLFGGRNVLFTVIEVNDPPQLGGLADQTATEGIAFNYLISGSDEEGDPFNFTISSNLTTLQIVQINSSHAVINFTSGAPTFADGGNYTVYVTIYETGNMSHNDSASFELIVYTVNQEPVIDPFSSPNASQGGLLNLTITASDLDAGDTLDFSINSSCGIANPWTINTTNSSANATALILVLNLTNDHVICRDVTITVVDSDYSGPKSYDQVNVTFNITNTNDPPRVNELSSNPLNSFSETNMSSLMTAINILFTYYVNATDNDSLTYEGEILNFTDNTTLFDINSTTGRVTFTPNASHIGSHLILITIEDDEGLNHSRIMNLTVENNTAPSLLYEPSITCDEDSNCTATFNATDPDMGEDLNFSITLINYTTASNATADGTLSPMKNGTHSAYIVKNFTNSMVGNYSYNITVTDRYGIKDYQLWNITVVNVNDAPFFDNDLDGTPDSLSFPGPVVEGYEVLWTVNVTDDDFANVAENLTLTTNITGPNTSLFVPTKISQYQWLVQFTPEANADGNYSVTFTVTDLNGSNDTQTLNFTIYNQSIAPTITTVQPFYNVTLGGTDLGSAPANLFSGSTAVTLSEGSTYTFNISFNDPDTSLANITISWYNDDGLLQTRTGVESFALPVTLDYFSSGYYNYTVIVQDNRYASDTFQWNVTIQNVNRQPVFNGNLANRTINATTVLVDQMSVFYDPDDDLNSNGIIDGSEVNTLTFTTTTSPYITITFQGTNTTLTPQSDGTAYIVYTAQDSGGLSAVSNNVTYIVDVPDIETTRTSSSSGGGGSSISIPIPIRKNPEPYSIDIIVPKPLVTYVNQTIEAPIELYNPSDQTLHTITMSAEAAVDNVSFEWSEQSFEDLLPRERKNTSLFITNYRAAGTYEIKVTATVDDPPMNDSAILFINSLEKYSEAEDAVAVKVTFARDLLGANPECAELNELVEQAQRAISTRQYEEASEILDAVVEGCRFLVQESASREELATGIDIGWLANFRYANTVLAGMLVVLTGIALLLFMHYHSASKKEE